MSASPSIDEAPSLLSGGFFRSTHAHPGRQPSTSSPPPPPPPPSFKLRPRSNSHPILEAPTALIPDASSGPQVDAHIISPDGLMYPSARSGGNRLCSPRKVPPPLFSPFFGPGLGACSSPVKKQKTHDRLRLRLSPAASPPSDASEKSRDEDCALSSPPTAFSSSSIPLFPSLVKLPSPKLPSLKSPSISTVGHFLQSSGKRSLPPADGCASALALVGRYEPCLFSREGEEVAASTSANALAPIAPSLAAPEALSLFAQGNTPEASNPLTPKGRHLLQNLCINSPSPTLSSVSPTPDNSGGSRQIINQQLPHVPTFSFSPSINLEKDRIFPSKESVRSNASNSSVRETMFFSAGSTPKGTPKLVPRGSVASSTTSSPFHSLRGQRTPIGHQRGSVFKMLRPRLYPNGRDDGASSVGSAAEGTTFATSSPFSPAPSPSPSPRLVPLTVLSKDGSPLTSPAREPHPLMRSLDLAKEDSTASLLSPSLSDVKMINITATQSSPMSSESSHLLLPKIKLTPRGKNRFVSTMLDKSPVKEGCNGLAMPRLAHLGTKEQQTSHVTNLASSFVTDFHEDGEAAEMDSLLSGFEQHKAAFVNGFEHHRPALGKKGSFSRVESEEAEIASLTQGPFQMPSLWLPPTAALQEKGDARCSRSSFTCSDSDASQLSSGKHKPVPTITLDIRTESEDAPPSHLSIMGASFLPRPLPVSQIKSRSLFDSSSARDPLEGILRADAIAEAARSNEPLTDEDSDMDGDDVGFLLCLPQTSPSKSSKSFLVDKRIPSKSIHSGSHTESPSFNRCSESPLFNKSRNARRNKGGGRSLHNLPSPTAPTIFEEGMPTLEEGKSSRAFNPMQASEGWGFDGVSKHDASDTTFTAFCSLSDCETSDVMASPKYPRTKALIAAKDRQSMCSLLSMSSLCGLDIVHEASAGTEAADIVPVLLPSESSESAHHTVRPMRSELSMNSLGLSVDSTDIGTDQRDLFTPPVVMGALNGGKSMLSPPPLRCRATSPVDAYHCWN